MTAKISKVHSVSTVMFSVASVKLKQNSFNVFYCLNLNFHQYISHLCFIGATALCYALKMLQRVFHFQRITQCCGSNEMQAYVCILHICSVFSFPELKD